MIGELDCDLLVPPLLSGTLIIRDNESQSTDQFSANLNHVADPVQSWWQFNLKKLQTENSNRVQNEDLVQNDIVVSSTHPLQDLQPARELHNRFSNAAKKRSRIHIPKDVETVTFERSVFSQLCKENEKIVRDNEKMSNYCRNLLVRIYQLEADQQKSINNEKAWIKERKKYLNNERAWMMERKYNRALFQKKIREDEKQKLIFSRQKVTINEMTVKLTNKENKIKEQRATIREMEKVQRQKAEEAQKNDSGEEVTPKILKPNTSSSVPSTTPEPNKDNSIAILPASIAKYYSREINQFCARYLKSDVPEVDSVPHHKRLFQLFNASQPVELMKEYGAHEELHFKRLFERVKEAQKHQVEEGLIRVRSTEVTIIRNGKRKLEAREQLRDEEERFYAREFAPSFESNEVAHKSFEEKLHHH